MSHRYIIGSGYHQDANTTDASDFFPMWLKNTRQHATPVGVYVLADSGGRPPNDDYQLIRIYGDLGYHLDLINGTKPHHFAGGPAMLMTLAMVAYCDESDLIYKEQDCLWFGDCVSKMYAELGDGGIIFGKCEAFPATNSLFLVRHAYIPEFVRLYLCTAPERDETQLCERKFERLLAEHPDKWKQFSFGYDRDRPFNMKDECFYAQQFTQDELTQLGEAGLL